MEFRTVECQSPYPLATICISKWAQPECLNSNLFSNSVIQNLFSLQKRPFLIQQQELTTLKPQSVETVPQTTQRSISTYNRKQKSLKQLSKKFLNQFQGKNIQYVELDKITKTLKVQKRRIYDIINILESLKVVSKNGKNSYKWKGLTQAIHSIQSCQQDANSLEVNSVWKEKSLQYLASGLLKLFLHYKPILSLEEAAKQIVKDIDSDSLRTKVRRLYDIVNVFKSLKLVEKTCLPNKKPGFKWKGTNDLLRYIDQRSQGNFDDEESFENQKCSSRKSQESFKDMDEELEEEEYESYFMYILNKKLQISSQDHASDIFVKKLWPETKKCCRKVFQENITDKENEVINKKETFPSHF